jgi:integrase
MSSTGKGRRAKGEHLFQRGRVWFAWLNTREVGPDGKERFKRTRRSTGTGSLELARKRLAEWERDCADPTSRARRAARLQDAFDLLVKDRKALVAAGKRSEDSMPFFDFVSKSWFLFAGRLIDGTSEETKDKELTKEQRHALVEKGKRMALMDFDLKFVEDFIAHRRENSITENTIAKARMVAKSALRLATRAGIFDGDLDVLFPPGFETCYEPRRVRWTHEEAARVMSRFDTRPHFKAQIAFALATGAEKRAVERARKDEVNMVPVPLHGTKTKDRERTAFVVCDWQRELLDIAKAGVNTDGDLAFQPWRNSTRDLEVACTAAEVPVVSFHGLRHICGGWLLDDGVTPLLVSKLLGHRDMRMISLVYDDRDPDAMQRRAEEQVAERHLTRRHLRAIEGGKAAAQSA